jgi:hypothetical protein
MKKVGFIDYYLDEWHANNYPEFIDKASGGRYQVCCAYGMIDSPIGGMTNKEWAEKYDIKLLDTIEEVIKQSDVLIVLSPDNPEMHEQLTDLPLKSGKLVYIDKTFAPDKEAALRIFENADKHNTKCYSSSALRFASELDLIDTDNIYKLYTVGNGTYEMYSIHQIEPIVRLMNTNPKRVMFLSDIEHPSMIIEFSDGRLVQMAQMNGLYQSRGSDFAVIAVDRDNNAEEYLIKSDYFSLFIQEMIKFFETGSIPVSHEATVNVISIREAGIKAAKNPFTWVEI